MFDARKTTTRRRKRPDQRQVVDTVPSPRVHTRHADASISLEATQQTQGSEHRCRLRCLQATTLPVTTTGQRTAKPPPISGLPIRLAEAGGFHRGERSPHTHTHWRPPTRSQRPHCSARRGNWRAELTVIWNWQKRTSGRGNTFQKQTYLCTSFYFL